MVRGYLLSDHRPPPGLDLGNREQPGGGGVGQPFLTT